MLLELSKIGAVTFILARNCQNGLLEDSPNTRQIACLNPIGSVQELCS